MKGHFEFIAIPRGYLPSGAVQSSDGNGYFVIPAALNLREAVCLLESMRVGLPVPSAERRELVEYLTKPAAD